MWVNLKRAAEILTATRTAHPWSVKVLALTLVTTPLLMWLIAAISTSRERGIFGKKDLFECRIGSVAFRVGGESC